jgi:hypothetical protein
MVPLVAPTLYRCGHYEDPSLLLPIAPRGRVFPGEARDVVVRFALSAPDSARFAFRVGTSHLLDLDVTPVHLHAETVRLDPTEWGAFEGIRGRIRWGAEITGSGVREATFWIDPPGPVEQAQGEHVRAILASAPARVRRLVLARLLLAWGFDQSALREAWRVLHAEPAEPHAAAMAALALGRLGLTEGGETMPLLAHHWIPASRLLEEERRPGLGDCDLFDPTAAEAVASIVRAVSTCGT